MTGEDDGLNDDGFDLEHSDDEAPGAHSKLLGAVSQLYEKKRVKAPTRKEPSLEVSEFHLSQPDKKQGRIKVTDLADVLNKRAVLTEIGRKLKTSKKRARTLPRPLEKFHADQITRAAGYEHAKRQLNRWDAVVYQHRVAEQLEFPLKSENVAVHQETTDVSKLFRKPTELEIKLAEMLKQPDPTKPWKEVESNGEEKEEEYPLTLAEIKERRKLMAHLRAQQSYKQAKAARQSKIKSKKFHQIKRRAKVKEQMKEFEELQKKDPEAALRKLEELERTRAEERVTLRHRSTGQWAKNLQVRAKYDKEARIALSEQLAKSKELTVKLAQDKHSESEAEEEAEEKESNPTEKEEDPNNPWVVKPSKEIEDFISGYRKFWESKEQNKESKKPADTVVRTASEVNKVTNVEVSNDSDEAPELIMVEEFESDERSKMEVLEGSSKKVVSQESSKKEVSQESSKKEVSKEISKKDVSQESSKTEVSKEISKKEVPPESSKTEVSQESSKKEVSQESSKKEMSQERSKKEVSKDISKKKVSQESSKKKVIQEGFKKGEKKVLNQVNSINEECLKSNNESEITNVSNSVIDSSSMNNNDLEVSFGRRSVDKNVFHVSSSVLNQDNNKGFRKSVPNDFNKSIEQDVGLFEVSDSCKKGVKKAKCGNMNCSFTISSTPVKKSNGKTKDKRTPNKTDLNGSWTVTNSSHKEDKVIRLDNVVNKENIAQTPTGKFIVSASSSEKESNRSGKSNNAISLNDLFDEVEDKLQDKVREKCEKLKESLSKGKSEEDSGVELDNEEMPSLKLKKRKVTADVDEELLEQTSSGPAAKGPGDLEKTLSTATSGGVKSTDDINPNMFLKVTPRRLVTKLPDLATEGEDAVDDEETPEARHLTISEAFAEDDVVDQFQREKDEEAKKNAVGNVDLTLPGWGSWGGHNIQPNRRKRKKFVIKFPEKLPRRDDNRGNVIINEDADKPLKEHQVSEVPYPFTSVKEYEASLRAPLGATWVPQSAHAKLTAPPIVTKLGTVIAPMDDSQLVKKVKDSALPNNKTKKSSKPYQNKYVKNKT